MSSIISYIVNMIPYMIISIPIYLIIRFIIIKRRLEDINWYNEIAMFIFVIFIVGLASQTIVPKFEFGNGLSIVKSRVHGTNLIPFKVLFDTYNEVFVNNNINYFLINFIGNIVIFMPIGFFIPLLWNLDNKKIILIGFCSSLFIETCQLFLARGTDVDDLILNTIGVFLGLLLYNFFIKKSNILVKFR